MLSTYNGEKYLKPLLESVFAQQGVNVVLFVRDDGSTDGTVAILQEYQKQGKLQLTVGKNLGFGQSFSWLINNAPKADYYACCDQDDVWLPCKLQNGVQALEQCNGNLPLLYFTSLIAVDQNLKEISRKTHEHYALDAKNRFVESLLFNMCQGCTTLFNNALKEKFIQVPQEQISAHDYTLNTIASGLGQVVFSQDAQVLYRQHANNTVGFYKGKLRNIFRSIKNFFKVELTSMRFKEAKIFKLNFYDQLSDENKRFVDLLCSYKKNRRARRELKKFIKQNATDKFIKTYTINLLRLKKL